MLYLGIAIGIAIGAVLFVARPKGGARKPQSPKAQKDDEFVQYKGSTKYNVDPDAETTIRVSKRGISAETPQTVMEVLKLAVEKLGSEACMRVEVSRSGTYEDAEWKYWTWEQYLYDIRCFARGLLTFGFKQHDCINVIGFNSPEWLIAHMGAIAAGGKNAGVYTTNGPEACQYIANHSEAKVAVLENEMQLLKFVDIHRDLPNLKAIVVWRERSVDKHRGSFDVELFTWDEWMKRGDQCGEDVSNQQLTQEQAPNPGNCCSLIYTSGTTGPPKAVMISHDNATWTAKALLNLLPDLVTLPENRIVSYLPLSHIAAQLEDVYVPILAACQLGLKGCVTFARPDALKGTLGITLKATNPTMFFGVPRVWEKMEEKMKQVASQTKGLKLKIARWSKARGAEAFENEQVGGSGDLPFGYSIANALVFKKVKAALGFTQCRYFLTGAAPIAHQTLRYFGALDIPILELYGMSECTGPQTVSVPRFFHVGSCGSTMLGVETKIDHDPSRDKAGEGEICFRGRHIMMGYMKNLEKTRQAIDPEGWLHSGDVGRFDENGLLYITGRIKELIITAGGENVAPVPVEERLKELLPAISGCMMVGDKLKFNSMLFTLRCVPTADGGFTDRLEGAALEVNPSVTTVQQAQNDETWRTYIQQAVDTYNSESVSRASRVQKWAILKDNFTVPGGELTPTLKLKRPIVMNKYEDVIAKFYN